MIRAIRIGYIQACPSSPGRFHDSLRGSHGSRRFAHHLGCRDTWTDRCRRIQGQCVGPRKSHLGVSRGILVCRVRLALRSRVRVPQHDGVVLACGALGKRRASTSRFSYSFVQAVPIILRIWRGWLLLEAYAHGHCRGRGRNGATSWARLRLA